MTVDYISECVSMVKDIQRLYGNCEKTGEWKKENVKEFFNNKLSGMVLTDNDEQENLKYFIDNILDTLIDTIVMIAKNKEMIKLFKKNCGCFKIPF